MATRHRAISVEGEFEDGSSIYRSVSFLENGSPEGLGYCMTIDDQAVTINSPRERAYDDNGHWNNLNIAVAPECAPNR